MSKLKGSLAAKIIAIILLAMCCLVLCGTIIGIAWLDSEGAYHDTSAESVRTAYIDSRLQRASIELLDRMQAIPVRSAYDSTVRFELLDEKGNVLAGNFSDKEAVEHSLSFGVPLYFDELYFTAEDQPLTAWDYRQNGGLRAEVTPTPVPVPTGTPV